MAMVSQSQTQPFSAQTMVELDVNCHLNKTPPPVPPRTYTPLTQDIRLKISNWVDDHYNPNEITTNGTTHGLVIKLQRVSLHLEQSPLRQRRLAKRSTPLLTNFNKPTYRKPRLVLKPASRPRPLR
ncbi:uncharacterized protein MELLADRAFT_115105 [Melampsora larici-populina 98AG31]|uniref:Uncharacterized protein n=1 Tax=Melampsora larici-populina (strain 98AG31 / pathotype 3-4-7) TaxID=747676 RepID=F4R5A2_MELLP|nr:uncharacterized protein MELLADRAFT_115105 [Melampsora larici-populina 98AG31]EGG12297.1 hypothetical protein MELLADRAFT_115105 [Melampsora larici-populina 98AG31]